MISRHFCFTAWKQPCYSDAPIRYMIYGEENCLTTGKLHYQGYVEFTRSVRTSAVKKYFNDNTMHLEKRRGTREQARAYCIGGIQKPDGTYKPKNKVVIEKGEFEKKRKPKGKPAPFVWNGKVIPIPEGYEHGTCYVCRDRLDMSQYPYCVYPPPHRCPKCTSTPINFKRVRY